MPEPALRRLGPDDAGAIAALLADDDPSYARWFTPFGTDGPAAELGGAERDRYWGIEVDSRLAAVILLRGLDAGFAAPAFGIYVAARWSRRGLASLALAWAETWCRLHGCPELMLTVHPENAGARRLYERHGFVADGGRSDGGNLVLRKRLA